MKIRLATQNDEQAWDAYVDSNPAVSSYCLIAWKKAVEQAYGHKGYYLLAEDNNAVKGVLPLVHFRIPWGKSTLVSLPFCDVGDVFAVSPEIKTELVKEAIYLSRRINADILEIRSCHERLLNAKDFDLHVDVQTDKVRMLLELPGSADELLKSFKSKLRSQVRKSEKNGLIFSWGTKENLNSFYQVFSRNMHVLGSPVHSKKWFKAIVDSYDERSRMGIVFYKDQPVGCGIILLTEDTVSIPWASTLREYNSKSPNMMLYWNFLKFAADNNKKTFDFGRSTPNEGTYKFKKQWGAVPQRLYWHKITNDKSWKETELTGIKREFVADLWQKMPLWAANFIGPKLRRYISL
jgi:FemAB-related protein (PEP-CTERM system-associated)